MFRAQPPGKPVHNISRPGRRIGSLIGQEDRKSMRIVEMSDFPYFSIFMFFFHGRFRPRVVFQSLPRTRGINPDKVSAQTDRKGPDSTTLSHHFQKISPLWALACWALGAYSTGPRALAGHQPAPPARWGWRASPSPPVGTTIRSSMVLSRQCFQEFGLPCYIFQWEPK